MSKAKRTQHKHKRGLIIFSAITIALLAFSDAIFPLQMLFVISVFASIGFIEWILGETK